jgi:cytoskeletal protein CcmA (bactofilin family)
VPETELREPASVTHANGKPEGSPITVLAEEDVLSGKLDLKGDGRLLGTFSGEIDCGGELMIGNNAAVSANIRTRNITISGLVKGNVTAVGKLKIASSGRLEGDARVGALIVQEGGVHHGVIRVHPEGLPADPEPVVAENTVPVAVVEPGPKPLTVSVDRVKKFWGEFF